MKLAIAQIVLGALIVGNYAASFSRLPAMPAEYRLILFPHSNVFLALGLAVLGCGIAQYLKERR